MIIKTMQDDDFAISKSYISFQSKANWVWGRGDDLNLYCQGSMSGFLYGTWTLHNPLKIQLSEEKLLEINNYLDS
jgi:hypothetical protein